MASSGVTDDAAFESSYRALQPLDAATAESVLKEAKQIMDQHGVVFFLRQGTCLGAIRDSGFIPWDDDLDLGSVIGLHGLTEKSIGRAVAAFRDHGYLARVERADHYLSMPLVKSSTRIDWTCYRIADDSVFHFPGVRIPVRLLTQLKEIDFIGEKFLVPNPPEEYLRFKYGPDWMIPKKTGWERDVVRMIPDTPLPGRAGRLKQFLNKQFLPRRTGKLKVLDHEGEPVSGAEVVVAGVGRSRTNKQGYAKFYLPIDDFYALVIRYDGYEEVLYEEKMTRGGTCTSIERTPYQRPGGSSPCRRNETRHGIVPWRPVQGVTPTDQGEGP